MRPAKTAPDVRASRLIGLLGMTTKGMTMDKMIEGKLWSWICAVMGQGEAIARDHENKTTEEYFARRDAAASERLEELMAIIRKHEVADNSAINDGVVKPKTRGQMKWDALNDNSCVGAFARAQP